ncbi:U3 small nucleolar ribonucleoprotein MPP10 isoform X2 [Sinocyclocheilus rhinocerous]|uniref:U3 small nucleolar ribonucleoprotein protein MPP10 n=1 Tax=Sinocyclocheilus rhinocerous TaxID=307959 RepID=A0A673MVC4_9TELE|nr:PREDICTED: U3 small nucleolar ribonucleoprotein protein MPP10-like isoform X1 [Sinocyclocheilus rhinocerous]XP_016421360.1 PREDICTED: U3 small nucleolar ribonucleoprotein protein MPP10-like isoform X2 [Sinocyclocheilus rhinocerous]
MATGDGSTLESCLQLLNSDTAHPDLFLSVQDALATDFKSLTKTLYDLHKAHEPADCKGSPLEQLVIENFDEEQIWQELELQNDALLTHFEEAVEQAVRDDTITFFDDEEEEEDVDNGEIANNLEDESAEEDDDDEDKEEEIKQRLKPSASNEDDDFSGEDSDLDFDVDTFEEKTKQKQSAAKLSKSKSHRTPSEVDDRFFKLSEMEAFLDDMDRREGKESAEDIDYFQNLPSDDDEELSFDKPVALTKQKKKKSSRDLKYKDFFAPMDAELEEMDPDEEKEPESSDDYEGEEDDGNELEEEDEDDMNEEDFEMDEDDTGDGARNALRKVTFDLPDDDSEGEDVEDILGGKAKNVPKLESKSSFERRQEKMAKKIEELENAALSEKPWQLTGEVSAQTRPENSMLEEDVAFDQASRMAPAITEETTLQLEDIIKQRIKDQVWDDVVRKEKPKEEVFEYKKRLTLDHEKSKLSLAEVYEQEYIKQTQEKKEEEENPAHIEIQKLMDTLFLKLDALSNFHFTPKPHIPEVKVVSNLPSITMEEVAPVNASDATLLAPEEIKEKNKAGDVLGDTEKTTTDKKRERRKKKKLKRLKIQEREKRQKVKEAMKGGDKKKSKAEVEQTLKKLTKGGKAKVLTNDGMDKALRSSQAFFSQLQDHVKSQIKGSKGQTAKKKKQKEISVNKLKL